MPTMKRKRTRPKLEMTFRFGNDLVGKMVPRYLVLRPRAEGPSRMPPSNEKKTELQ